MAEGQKLQSPRWKFDLLRRLQAVLRGTDRVRERPQRNSDQLPVRLGIRRLQVFGVLAPSHAAIAHGVRLDLTLTLNFVHSNLLSVGMLELEKEAAPPGNGDSSLQMPLLSRKGALPFNSMHYQLVAVF